MEFPPQRSVTGWHWWSQSGTAVHRESEGTAAPVPDQLLTAELVSWLEGEDKSRGGGARSNR